MSKTGCCKCIACFDTPEVETPNKIWPFRILKGVHIFIFFQIANLAIQILIFFKTQIWTGMGV